MSADRVRVLWLNAGLSCDGDSIAFTSATQPSLEDFLDRALPGMPELVFDWPLLAYDVGDDFLAPFHRAAAGELDEPFIFVIEGSVPNEEINGDGYWAAMGTDAETGQPITTTSWIDRIAPHAWAVVAIGTCAAYGGIHAMAGNPTGAMGVPDHLGWDWRSQSGLPVVCVPGCPTHPDSFAETLLWLAMQAAGERGPLPLDNALRPTWLFEDTVHEGCDRAGYYEGGDFAGRLGSKKCIVKQGCWGPVVRCNVPKRGWINGIGGCPNVGGICIGCTMPGFPDKFLPFLDEPPGGKLSSAISKTYGGAMRRMREFTMLSLDDEPAWRRRGDALLSGYRPTWSEPADEA